jgi:surface antigen
MTIQSVKEKDIDFKKAFLGAAALLAANVAIAQAQPNWVPPGNDQRGYYSEFDRNGYYDREGRYQRMSQGRRGGGRFNGPPPPPPGQAYYEQGRYEENCRRGSNTAAGTIFGALAGGLIGGAASNGNGGAVAGGAILGGLLGNTISRNNIDCADQPVAFNVYAQGLNGDLNRRYDWRGRQGYGYFTPTREFRRGGVVCRDYSEVVYRNGREERRTGTACRETSGNWRFDQ